MRELADRRVLALLMLGFSAGIPLLLIFSSLSLWLREAGVERSAVTFFSWAALGYSFKFIWAPLVDRLPLPWFTRVLGRRRGWLLLAQFAVIGSIALMASVDPAQGERALVLMGLAAVLLGFSAATQDIVIDAFRIECAEPRLQGILSSAYIAGYRIGMVVSGAGALFLAALFLSSMDSYSYEAWRLTYLIMAATMLLGVATTLLVREPRVDLLVASMNEAGDGTRDAANLRRGQIAASSDQNPDQGRPSPFASAATSAGTAATVPGIAPSLAPGIAPDTASSTGDHLRLVLVFLISVSAFVAGFFFSGPLFSALGAALDGTAGGAWLGPVLRFFSEALHFSTAIALAAVVGWGLVRIGLVETRVARQTWVTPVLDFFRRYGLKTAVLLLALIGLYRISDIVLGVISNVFYQDLGFSKTEIAEAVKTFGVIVSIAGGFLGGLLATRFGVMRILMLGAVLAAATNLIFVALALAGRDIPMLYLTVAADNLAAGLASAAFVAFLSSLTNVSFTAVQYAIFSSLMTLLPKVLGGYSGTMVDNIGYPAFFVFTTLIGIPVIALVWLASRRLRPA